MERNTKMIINEKMIPLVVSLIGILLMCIGMFLPYFTAVGEMAEYIEKNPDRIESKNPELTAGDMENVPLISVNKIITAIYGEDDGTVAVVVVAVFAGFLALTALFVFIKKPVAVMLFDLLACGVFLFLNSLVKEDFIDPDKYAWGIGWYVIAIAGVIILSGAIWMLVNRIIAKRGQKTAPAPVSAAD